jgi:hypothetical protein
VFPRSITPTQWSRISPDHPAARGSIGWSRELIGHLEAPGRPFVDAAGGGVASMVMAVWKGEKIDSLTSRNTVGAKVRGLANGVDVEAEVILEGRENLSNLDQRRHAGPGVNADWSRYNSMCCQPVIPDWTSWTTWTS